jgi:homoserine dehydrogenase
VKACTVGVGLLACESSHPFNNTRPDNLVAITTNFYTRPLVIQGAEAGGDVTATGVLATVCNALTAKVIVKLLRYSFSFTTDGQTLHRLEQSS